ncbi:c-type cytochrome [Sporosarcina luteola]|uniref:c-type cytochrome n=1 Tax=Sporosarcina luteola TaxID=582850 RepID=UPI002040CDF9|nr:c-type cytochrome [Sporosarcina luteola]MCM3744265.1 c-type cytochrome [Sporosarcina luteola]
MKRSTTLTIGFLFLLSLGVIVLLANQLKTDKSLMQEGSPAATEEKSGEIAYNPPSIDDVPEGPMGDAILRGRELINDTSNAIREKASSVEDGENLVNQLSCTSCHAGDGLDQDTSSLVGVAAVYPQYNERADKVLTLEDRINGCMVRSMNGQPFEEDDEDLNAMVAYLTYISEGIPMGAELKWLGKNDMKDVPIPDVENGERVFQQSCVACHASDGSGTGPNTGPALWGDGSFNDGAGMARMSKNAGFIKNNMPLGQPNSLTDQEAADLAAFILSQDRPEWKGHDKDWPKGNRPTDVMTKELRDQVKDGTIDWEKVLGKDK